MQELNVIVGLVNGLSTGATPYGPGGEMAE